MKGPPKGGPSAHDLLESCDSDKNGMLNQDEAHDCVDKMAPEV